MEGGPRSLGPTKDYLGNALIWDAVWELELGDTGVSWAGQLK